MPITLKLSGGVEIHLDDADFEKLEEAFKKALGANEPLLVMSPEGRTMVVNPHNVLYMEGPTDPSHAASSAVNGHPAPEPIV